MKFCLGLSLDAVSLDEATRKSKSAIVYDLQIAINNLINKKNYGDGIIEYVIKVYIMNPPEGYEHLYKDFKPKYVEHKLLTNKYTGEKFEIKKYFNYSIKIEGGLYHKFTSSSNEESRRILAQELLKSLSYLDALPKKVKNFDKERFKSDIEQFFREQNLL